MKRDERSSHIISQDEKFLEEFKAEIEKVLSDPFPVFNIDKICDKRSVGRTTLYRRVKEITGKTPNDFIMDIRLERAAELLKNNAGNVGEVTQMVGFSKQDYFARLFKKKFKQSPKAYQLSFKKSNLEGDQVEAEEPSAAESPEPGVTFMLQISTRDMDRELPFRVPLPGLGKLFQSTVGTPQREELYQFIKNIYDPDSLSPSAAHDALKYHQTPEIIKKMQKNIEDLRDDVFRKGNRPGMTGSIAVDRFDVGDGEAYRNTGAVALVCMESGFRLDSPGSTLLETLPFGKTFNFCYSEPFYDQVVAVGALGTAVLVAGDMVVTAAHMVNDKNVTGLRFLFDFVMEDPVTPPDRVQADNVYKGIEIIDRVHNPDVSWALVKLDRSVKGREAVSLSQKNPFYEQPIYVIGHPLGLPLKLTPGAPIHRLDPGNFSAELDVYSSGSGSPIFCAETHELIGIVSRSRPADLRWTGSCLVSLPYRNNALDPRGSQCTRASQFTEQIQKP
jgi:AraC-like DNA-binding protein/V8-like Glu-specific endopeptidase